MCAHCLSRRWFWCRYAAQIVVGSSKPLSSLPRNTYQLFVRQSSTEILAKHPEVKTIADRSRVLAAEWKRVPAEEKDRFDSLAQPD